MLATAVVMLMDRNMKAQPGRAFLDSGSEGSFITESYAKRLGLTRQRISCVRDLDWHHPTLEIAKWTTSVEFRSRFHLPGDEKFQLGYV